MASFLFGADDRTRTCTLARWNLNPMSLPIPPHPQVGVFYHSAMALSIGMAEEDVLHRRILVRILAIVLDFPSSQS